jgi:hypothetical protein
MLSANQRKLLIDLSRHVLAELETREHMHVPGHAGTVFYHGGESSFEAACDVLQKLHLANTIDEKLVYFRLANRSAVEQVLSGREAFPEGILDEALSVFLDLKINYGFKPPFKETRSEFAIAPRYEPTFELLRACGYVDGQTPHARWTNACGPAMRRAYFWTADNQPFCEIDNAEIDAEARRILATVPADVKRAALERGDVVLLTREIVRRWRDGRWWYSPVAEFSLSGQVELARRVMALYQSGSH